MAKFVPGVAIRPGEYSAGGSRVRIAADGRLVVQVGDSISKYASCLYGDARAGWSDFGRVEAGGANPLSNPKLIRAGETLVHIPTFLSAGTSAAVPAASKPTGKIPTKDGEINKYPTGSTLSDHPLILYVNGMNTKPEVHAAAALHLSEITEKTVYGLYNATNGFAVDLGQCALDSIQSMGFQLLEFQDTAINKLIDVVKRRFTRGKIAPTKIGDQLRQKLTLEQRTYLFKKLFSALNPATASLFQWLLNHAGERIFIVAHSQGNLITSGALWALQTVSGPGALKNLQVYSLASPSPAWPEGINFRIKVYGHLNDLVPFADPKSLLRGNRTEMGDWRKHGDGSIGLGDRHDIKVNILNSNFAKRIRSDIGVDPMSEKKIKDQSLPYTGPGSKS